MKALRVIEKTEERGEGHSSCVRGHLHILLRDSGVLAGALKASLLHVL